MGLELHVFKDLAFCIVYCSKFNSQIPESPSWFRVTHRLESQHALGRRQRNILDRFTVHHRAKTDIDTFVVI